MEITLRSLHPRCLLLRCLALIISYGCINAYADTLSTRANTFDTATYNTKSNSIENNQAIDNKITELEDTLTIDNSVIQEQSASEAIIEKTPFGITLTPQTYLLPYYYTGSPDQKVYKGHTPSGQRIQNEEFKVQFGLQLPLWRDIFSSNVSLHASYQQLSYWQFYNKSQFFRETNYEPAIYLETHWLKNSLWQVGVVHQSNGRGDELERSWNRAYLDFRYSGKNWLISLKPWLLIFKDDSSDLHNPDINDFLGYGRLVLAYQVADQTFSIKLQNLIESGFEQGSVEVGWGFPLTFIGLKNIRGFVQVFNGYGQSLIEYNHRTTSAGVGVILSDWI